MAGISESGFSKACKTVGEVARVAVKVLCVSALVAAVVASVFLGIASMFTGGLPLALTLIATIGTVVTTNVPAVVIGSAIVALGISYCMIPDRKGGDDELPSRHSVLDPYPYLERENSTSSSGSEFSEDEFDKMRDVGVPGHPTPFDTQSPFAQELFGED